MRSKILLAILLFTSTLIAYSPVQVRLSPSGLVYKMHPTAHIETHIDKDADNRNATLELIAEDFYSRSDFEVQGMGAVENCSFDVRNLVPGEYVAYLTVHKLVGGKWKDVTAQSEKMIVLY